MRDDLSAMDNLDSTLRVVGGLFGIQTGYLKKSNTYLCCDESSK